MGKGLISIIVPIYKVEDTLDRCMKSIMNQTYHDLEIILVDDGSPDKCPKMCDEYAMQDARIKVIHKMNGGLSDARNAGLKIAYGKYVMYVDSDDYIELDSCERLAQCITDNVDIVVGGAKEVCGENIIFQKHTNIETGIIYTAKDYVIHSIDRNEWYAPAWLNLYRRDFLIENNLYFKVGYYYEDVEMLPRLFLANPKVTYLDYPFYNYIIRENSIMTSELTKEKVDMAISIYSEWYDLISTVSDLEYRNRLYGVLVKYYMANAWRGKIRGWNSKGLNLSFAWKYALNFRERLKVLIFSFAPDLFFLVAKSIKKSAS